jgi:hypothetical protein
MQLTLRACCALLALGIAPSLVSAYTCEAEPPDIVWSWPEKHATDTPLNTRIVLIPSYGTEVVVTLNDVPILPRSETGFDRFVYEPAELLEPNTQYQIVATVLGEGTTKKFQRQFTTGDTSLDVQPIGGSIDAHVTSLVHLSTCDRLLATQRCPEPESNNSAAFPVTVTWSYLAIRESDGFWTVWPNECLAAGFPITGEPCLEVKTFDAAGQETSASKYCPSGPDPESGGSRGGRPACTASRGPASRAGLIGLSIVFLGVLGLIRRSRFECKQDARDG